MTVKNCSHRHEGYKRLACHLFFFFFFVVLLVVLLVFLILRPAKPSFVLRDATVYKFNTTSSPATFLTTTIQVTLSTRNPNARIGIYYQKLDAYVSYRDQQITIPVLLPESYQGHKEIVEWSPFLQGGSVPVSPFLVKYLAQDQNAGTVLVNIKVDGRVKWKVGTWVSGKYNLHVSCPALLVFKGRDNDITGDGITVQPSMKIQLCEWTCDRCMGNKPAKEQRDEVVLMVVPPIDQAYVRRLAQDIERIHGFTPRNPRPPDHYIEYMHMNGWLDVSLDDPDLAHLFK